jgi:glycosyltransferase involved in cell wall biosynthesis
MAGVELLIVDNFGCDTTREFLSQCKGARYIRAPEVVGTSAPRDLVFREAAGDAVLCLDSHVLLAPNALARLKQYYRDHPGCMDLLQGPLVNDDLDSISTHFEPVWSDQMWGTWGLDPRATAVPDPEPFDIPMQGLGLFSCRKSAWPGFHPAFRGFGGEEGYIHEKFRKRGRRCLCLPWLRWVHRFGRPAGAPYPLRLRDRITNYLIGHREVGLDEAPILDHFRLKASEAEINAAVREADLALERSGAPAIHRAPPLISCLCPTYGRAGTPAQLLLEESVESFLRQTDVHSELVILNDHPAQELVFNHPRVRIVNHPERYRTLGEKYNAMVALAAGTLLAPWEDDDISLPNRLEFARDRLGERDYYNPRRYWCLDRDGLRYDHPMGYGHNLSLFRKRSWQTVGGYPAVTGSQDAEMDKLLTASPQVSCRVDEKPLAVPEWFYIYRWGISPNHLSASPDMQGFYDAQSATAIEPGRFLLAPRWREDFSALAAEAVKLWRFKLDAEHPLPRDGARQPRHRSSGCDTTYKRAGAYLSGVGQVEDWGCGSAYFQRFIPLENYRGVDDHPSSLGQVVADLADFRSTTDGILLRHVLEHDRRWRTILRNALASFRKRMVIVISTPFKHATTEVVRTEREQSAHVEIHFARADLVREFRGIAFRIEENVKTESPHQREHLFYLSKVGPA